MNFYHMSTQNISLSLTEGRNLRNFYWSLVNVETLIRESAFLKKSESVGSKFLSVPCC